METKALAVYLWITSRLEVFVNRIPSQSEVIANHLRRFAIAYALGCLTFLNFAYRYEFAINVSESLPGHLYLIERNKQPERGDYVAFYYGSEFLYPKGTRFLKRVMGVAGDTAQSKNHHFTVNGQAVGTALSTTSAGKPIEENHFNGVIPTGHYYVMATHPLSLDSRYEAVGLISSNQVIGRAFQLF